MRLRLKAGEWIIRASAERQLTPETMARLNQATRDVTERFMRELLETEREPREDGDA